jgi:hypothetical protein
MTSMIPRMGPVASAVAALTVLSLGGRAQTLGSPERFTALAVNQDAGSTTSIEIVVERWSTDAERDRLLKTLLDNGPDKLLDVLQDVPKVGYVRTTTSVGWDLHYARHIMLPDGGEQVTIATDRPVNFWETRNQARTLDYPFSVIELRLKANGEGEGKLSIATKIVADKENNTIVLENYGTQPALLQGVKREKGSS